MRAFVTGADGFVGQWLIRALLLAGDEVTGGIHLENPALTTLDSQSASQVRWLRADVTDDESLKNALAQAKPEAVYHLAALSSVQAANKDPLGAYQTNVLGTARLLEACRVLTPAATILCVGSADAYGAVEPSQVPLREDAPLRPASPYAASKAAAETIALHYARAGHLRVVCTRSFNHTGPGQSPAFAASAFAKRIADLKKSGSPAALKVGNLATRRDMSDVRDVVLAYRLLVERGAPAAAYNVCSGHAVSMREIVNELMGIAGVTAKLEEDPQLLRPVDTPLLVGDPAALRRDTGWMPAIPLMRTLSDLFNWHMSAA